MPEETEIQKLAEYAGRFFERKPGGEGDHTVYIFKKRYPEWLFALVRKVHENGHWLPDNYKFLYVVEALNHLSEGMNPEEPELEADVYTSDLLGWLASHRERLGLVDEAIDQLGRGWNKEEGIEGLISLGQWYEKDQVFRIVAQGLEERLAEIAAGVEETMHGGPGGVLDWEPRE